MTRPILVIDQGTTNTKVVAVAPDGSVLATAEVGVVSTFPRPGWVEHDPSSIWGSVIDAVDKILTAQPEFEYAAIAISVQREASVIWSRTDGRPLGPVVSWQCTRTASICDGLSEEGLGPVVKEKTGLRIGSSHSATKFRWLLDQTDCPIGDVCVGTVDSWLLWNLTGGRHHLTDVGNASRTLLFNIHTLAWDDQLAEIFGVPLSVLPECRPSGGDFGTVVNLDDRLNGLPIVAMVADSHAALYGHGTSTGITAKATYGTGTSVMITVPNADSKIAGLSTTVAWGFENKVVYAVESNIAATGAAIQWIRDVLGCSYEELEVLATSVEDTGDVYFVPAFSGLEVPNSDRTARGLICGLTRGTGRAELARAAFEAVSFQVKDVYDAMMSSQQLHPDVLYADGGASRNHVLMQLQADILGIPVAPALDAEVSAVGAALIGAHANDLWPPETGFVSHLDAYLPATTSAERQERHLPWSLAVVRSSNRSPVS